MSKLVFLLSGFWIYLTFFLIIIIFAGFELLIKGNPDSSDRAKKISSSNGYMSNNKILLDLLHNEQQKNHIITESQPLTGEYLLPILEELKLVSRIKVNLIPNLISVRLGLSSLILKESFRFQDFRLYMSNEFYDSFDGFSRKLNLSFTYRISNHNTTMNIYLARILEAIFLLDSVGYIQLEYSKNEDEYYPHILITSKGLNVITTSQKKNLNFEYLIYLIQENKRKNKLKSQTITEYDERDDINSELNNQYSPWDDVPSIEELFNEGDLD